jgi:fibronectin-binding autotransporter adhesin
LRNVAIGTERLSAEGQGIAGEMPGSLVTCIGSCSWAGQVLLDTNLVVVGDLTFTGDISGSGGIGFFGGGTSQLGGSLANSYTGTTLVRCPLLELNKPPMFRAYGGPLVVGGGARPVCEARWLQAFQAIVGPAVTLYANGVINLNSVNQDFGPVTFNGGLLETGTGLCKLYQPLTVNPAATTAVITGNLELPVGTPPNNDRVFIVGDGAADPDLLVNAAVSGSPGGYFVKQGAGTMSLPNANTFNAPTLLEEGILDINGPFGLGTWPGLHIFNGATLRSSGAINTSGGIEVLGAGVGGTHGAIEVLPSSSFATSGNVLLDAATTVNAGASGSVAFSGLVSGTGPLTKIGAGSLLMSGGANNTYSGDTVISAGSLLLAKSANKICVPGNLIIGPGPAGPTTFARLIYSGEMGGTTVTVNGNSLFDLNGNNQILTQLTLRDGGTVWTGNGTLSLADGASVNVGSLNGFGSHATATITGKIGLPIGSADFNVSPRAPTPPLLFGPELDIPATISGGSSGQLTVLNKYGLGQMRLSGNNTYLNQTRIYEGTMQVDGSQSQSTVLGFGGTLQGIGTVGAISLTAPAAAVAPGDSPGILTCGNFGGGGSGSLNVELNGTTPGSTYDQLNVLGTVNLTGMSLNASLGYASSASDQFTIIANDGSDPVTGTFIGLPEGKKFYLDGELFQISYGNASPPANDVVLTRLVTPPRPTLTIERLTTNSVGLFWATNDPPFSLQTATNLPSANWVAALPLPAVIGTNNVVTNSVAGARRFYRLSNP